MAADWSGVVGTGAAAGRGFGGPALTIATAVPESTRPNRSMTSAGFIRLQPCEALVGAIAGDQRCVDRSDRRADYPVRLLARLVQRLVDARLVRAERAAALQDEHRLAFDLVPDA